MDDHHAIFDRMEEMAAQDVAISEQEDRLPIHVPAKFRYFYDSELMGALVSSVVAYTVAMIGPADTADTADSAVAAAVNSTVTPSGDAATRHLRYAGQCYARIVLHCSNFENTDEDQSFFECILIFLAEASFQALDQLFKVLAIQKALDEDGDDGGEDARSRAGTEEWGSGAGDKGSALSRFNAGDGAALWDRSPERAALHDRVGLLVAKTFRGNTFAMSMVHLGRWGWDVSRFGAGEATTAVGAAAAAAHRAGPAVTVSPPAAHHAAHHGGAQTHVHHRGAGGGLRRRLDDLGKGSHLGGRKKNSKTMESSQLVPLGKHISPGAGSVSAQAKQTPGAHHHAKDGQTGGGKSGGGVGGGREREAGLDGMRRAAEIIQQLSAKVELRGPCVSRVQCVCVCVCIVCGVSESVPSRPNCLLLTPPPAPLTRPFRFSTILPSPSTTPPPQVLKRMPVLAAATARSPMISNFLPAPSTAANHLSSAILGGARKGKGKGRSPRSAFSRSTARSTPRTTTAESAHPRPPHPPPTSANGAGSRRGSKRHGRGLVTPGQRTGEAPGMVSAEDGDTLLYAGGGGGGGGGGVMEMGSVAADDDAFSHLGGALSDGGREWRDGDSRGGVGVRRERFGQRLQQKLVARRKPTRTRRGSGGRNGGRNSGQGGLDLHGIHPAGGQIKA